METRAPAPEIDDLQGLWRRSLMVWPDGRRDTTTAVSWLQGPRSYIDLRQPPNPVAFVGVRGLRDLGSADVAWLATQEGFAGRLNFDGTYFEWQRMIDFQPRAIYSDCGLLSFSGGVLVEEGRDIAYVEHWHRDAPPGLPRAAALLNDPAEGCLGMVVRVGSLFMYARDRQVATPAELHLTECVQGASSLSAAQDLVDCEISLGRVGPGGWIIERSTLPYKVARRLDAGGPRAGEGRYRTADVTLRGEPAVRAWDIVEAEGDLRALLAPAAPPE